MLRFTRPHVDDVIVSRDVAASKSKLVEGYVGIHADAESVDVFVPQLDWMTALRLVVDHWINREVDWTVQQAVEIAAVSAWLICDSTLEAAYTHIIHKIRHINRSQTNLTRVWAMGAMDCLGVPTSLHHEIWARLDAGTHPDLIHPSDLEYSLDELEAMQRDADHGITFHGRTNLMGADYTITGKFVMFNRARSELFLSDATVTLEALQDGRLDPDVPMSGRLRIVFLRTVEIRFSITTFSERIERW